MKAQRQPNPSGESCDSEATHKGITMLVLGGINDGEYYIHCVYCGKHWQFNLETLEIWSSGRRR